MPRNLEKNAVKETQTNEEELQTNEDGKVHYVVAKTEFIHTPTIEIDLNSQIHLVSTSELIENDSLNRKITQAINKSVKITEYQTMNCLPFCVKTYIM